MAPALVLLEVKYIHAPRLRTSFYRAVKPPRQTIVKIALARFDLSFRNWKNPASKELYGLAVNLSAGSGPFGDH